MTEKEKIKILKEAGINDSFDRYEVEETENEYKIYDMIGDTLGCILVGRDFVDIDGDGHVDVTESRKTLNQILRLSQDEVLTRVHNNYKPNVI